MTTRQGSWGFDLNAIDYNSDPGDDFFRYANGKWIDETEIPDDQISWDMFSILQNKNIARLGAILEELADQNNLADKDEKLKLRNFYRAALDMERRNRDGINFLKPYFERIAAVKASEDFCNILAELQLIGAGPLWSMNIDQNPKDSAMTALFLLQGGLGLLDREYYLAGDKAEIRDKYTKHILNMFTLLGCDTGSAEAKAKTVLAIETELARVSWKRSRLRDIASQCNYFTVEGLEDLTPSINWRKYFAILGVDISQPVIVGQPGFFARAQELLKNIAIDDWKAYFSWQLIDATAYDLDDAFIDEKFDFYGKILSGQKQLRLLWERTAAAIDCLMGEAIGKIYVERHFGSEAQTKIQELVEHIVAAFKERVSALSWMSPETKAKAIEKLHAINWKIGYPKRWRDYSGLNINIDAHILNIARAREFNLRWWLSKVGKPVDRDMWTMSPPTVNAYANPGLVEMVFPAGILQWPFFDPTADDAVNYGAIGVVIAHELTHHFDDEGSAFGKDGNLSSWWTPEDKAVFEERAGGLVEQFNRYELYGARIDGKLTLGENIADLGGVAIAFNAYQKSLKGKERRVLDGFTAEQRFFLGYAQMWRAKKRKEAVLQYLIIDTHAPETFRANGPLSNAPEFYKTFNIRETNVMFRPAKERVNIW